MRRWIPLVLTLLAQPLLATWWPTWEPSYVQLVAGQTTTVKLRRPVPVRLLYLTAVPQNGAIVSVPDIYGWDPQLLARRDTAARGSRV